MSTPQSQQIKALKEQVNAEILRRSRLENLVRDYFLRSDDLRQAVMGDPE